MYILHIFSGKTLNVVASINAEPYSFIKNGKVYGHDIDVIYRISKKLGTSINLHLMPLEEAQKVMREGKADILLGVDDSKAHTVDYNYSFPLNHDMFVAFGKTDFEFVGELKNKRIAVVGDSSVVEKYNLESNIIQYYDYKIAFDAVANGLQDVVICRYAIGKYIIDNHPSMKALQPIGPVLANHCICIGINKENPELLSQINAVIQEMHLDGTLDALYEKWLGKYANINSLSMFFYFYKNYIFQIIFLLLILFLIYIFSLKRKIIKCKAELVLDEKVISYFTHETDMVYIKWDLESRNIIEVINGEILSEFKENGEFTFLPRMAYENDVQRCEIMFNSLFNGILVTDFIFKRCIKDKGIKFFQFSGSAFSGINASTSSFVVGALKCIDDTIKEIEPRQEKEIRDALTGVYNKNEGEKFIIKYLESCYHSTCNALFLIDIDCFSMINETYGRLYGDIAIVKVAEILKLSFRSSDIVYRLGGDIFVVLMKDCPSHEFAALKAKTICSKSNAIYLSEGKQQKVSVSIGIAFYPESGTCFLELLNHAQKALDSVKKKGRNGFTIL